jgi:predicted phosphoribosyltransferase/dienelactone hydrolase
VIVLGLARGGVPVAFEVARGLRAPLDVCIVRKLGVPGREDLAMGAVASDGPVVLNRKVVDLLRIPNEVVEAAVRVQAEEIARLEQAYREVRSALDVTGQTVILVDDGVVTGATMAAAVAAVRSHGPAQVIVAVPVAGRFAADWLRKDADEIFCLSTPASVVDVGEWYQDFPRTTDEDVRTLLAGCEPGWTHLEAAIDVGDDMQILAELVVPSDARAAVAIARPAGNSQTPRNRHAARALNDAKAATLLLDLLTETEDDTDRLTGSMRFDVDLLASRLADATDWLTAHPSLRSLAVGYFAEGTAAAAALAVAAQRPDQVGALVAYSGRPDLVADSLASVCAPALLIVGADDWPLVDPNHRAIRSLGGRGRLEIVGGASHQFEEPGAFDRVIDLGREWLVAHLLRPKPMHTRRAHPPQPSVGTH